MERGYVIEDDRILRRLYLQLMIANVLIGLVLPFNQFLDSMLTGKGLGSEAFQSFALFLPIGALVTALSSFFSIGTQITCSHMLGNGRFRETGKLIQTALLSAFVFSLLLAAVLLLRSSQIAKLLGADGAFSGRIQDIAAYLQGYAPGIPAILLVGIMMSLLQLEGRKKLVILLSLCIFFINGAGDLANIFLFKKGIILNIQDNCPFFDPTRYYDRIKGDIDPLSGIGVRLVMNLAKEIVYTNSFNLNNVMIVI